MMFYGAPDDQQVQLLYGYRASRNHCEPVGVEIE